MSYLVSIKYYQCNNKVIIAKCKKVAFTSHFNHVFELNLFNSYFTQLDNFLIKFSFIHSMIIKIVFVFNKNALVHLRLCRVCNALENIFLIH